MAGTTVLRDVGDTIKKLLRTNISELSGEGAISFDSPMDIVVGTSPVVSLFLYQIVENGAMRNNPSDNITDTSMSLPPLVVDIYYLITPYAQNRETEFLVLEQIMQVLYDNSIVKPVSFEGNLATHGNSILRIVHHDHSVDELNKLWERFPGKAYKTSLSYMVTPVKIPSVRSTTFTRVEKRAVEVMDIEKLKK